MKVIVFIAVCVLALFIAEVIAYLMDGNIYMLIMDRDFVYYMTGYFMGGFYLYYVEGYRPL